MSAVPAGASGIGFSIVKSPNPGDSQGTYLGGVSCSSATACATVGHEVASSGFDRALVEIWNGAGWGLPPLHLPAGTVSSELYKVSCTSATACLGVGKYEPADGIDRPLAETWNGSVWTLALPVPSGSAGSVLNSVSCTAATTCMAVGYDATSMASDALIEQWNGTSWTILPAAAPAGLHPSLSAVSCTTATTCIAVGEYAAAGGYEHTLGERWNGVHWYLSKTLDRGGTQSNYLDGIACVATNSCTAVGDHDSSPGVARTLVETFDGSHWALATSRSPANKSYSGLVGVACASSTSCIAVGADAGPGSSGKAFAESWDGTAWSLQKVANPRATTGSYLNGAYCPATGPCTFAGGYAGKFILERTLIETATPPA